MKAIGLLLLMLATVCSLEAKEKWEVLKGRNFEVYYKQVPEDFAQTVLSSAEEEFKRVTENLGISRYQGWSWDKASIYIYDDQEDYVKNGGQAGWSHGVAFVREKLIKTYPSAQGFFDSLLPHELGHIIFREFVGINVQVPLWFEEGVAMFQEKARRIGSEKEIVEAIEKGQFIPLSRLTDMQLYNDSDQATVQLFYAESANAVNFMINELGDFRFYKLMRELKANTPFEEAVKRAYVRVKDMKDLDRQWQKFLKGGS